VAPGSRGGFFLDSGGKVRHTGKILIGVVIFLFLTITLSALTIKMGTLIPPGSPWDQNLKILAADWAKLTNGKVILKVYAGGRAGDEPDMLRKLRFNQLQAVGLTMVGLAQIFEGILSPAVPMMIENTDELYYVLNKMKPVIEEEFEKKGFKILFWNVAGWGHIFSRDAVVYPADLRPQKIWVMEGSTDETKAWKQLGFKAVNFSTMDMMVQLQSGGVDAFVSNPLIAASNQWFGIADNMTEFRWAPVYGAFVISRRIWDGIPEEFHEGMLEAGERCAQRMDLDTVKANEEAIEIMKKYGLVINSASRDAIEQWMQFIRRGLDLFVAGKFDIKYFYQAEEYVNEYRRSHGPK
jgi:TRAP-type C4-dicarboxylate transport system substrate-binding protein